MKRIIILFSAVFILIQTCGCFYIYDAKERHPSEIEQGTFKASAKVFMNNNNFIIFPKGYYVDSSGIYGEGRLVTPLRENSIPSMQWIGFDSITAMVTYEDKTPAERHFGSCIMAGTGIPMLALSLYCLACPKCCFGSCPTVYTIDESNEILQAELFSECISSRLENEDTDLIKYKITDTSLCLRITNEAMETHFINKFEAAYAEHPPGTELYATIENRLTAVGSLNQTLDVKSRDGISLNDLLQNDDGTYYRSGVEAVEDLKKGPVFDYFDLRIPANGRDKICLVTKYRNTLLSTTLLYDVVIGSQGIKAMEWQKKMNEDAGYASMFKTVYETFSGIYIKVNRNSVWQNAGKFRDAGPLNWKYMAAELDAAGSDTLLVRLEFIPDNFMIDYIAYTDTYMTDKDIEVISLIPVKITDRCGEENNSINELISKPDDKYLVTEPGDFYNLVYKPGPANGNERTLILYSQGYYLEWIRGDWIRNSNTGYSFDLFDIQSTLNRLAESWTENHTMLEQEFFRSRMHSMEDK